MSREILKDTINGLGGSGIKRTPSSRSLKSVDHRPHFLPQQLHVEMEVNAYQCVDHVRDITALSVGV